MKTRKEKKIVAKSMEEIEELALQGKDVNAHFSGGKMMPPVTVQRVNVDFGMTTLRELDSVATEFNVSRQAVIKLFIQRELDQHFLAKKAKKELAG